jgi:hypothetical protein
VDNQIAFDPPGSFVYTNHYGSDTVSDVVYQIGDLEVIIDPKYSTSMDATTCPLTASLFVLDEFANQWTDISVPLLDWISLFQQTATLSVPAGYLTIEQPDLGFIAEQTYNLKIRLQDLMSMNPVQSAIETFFQVTVYHKCSRNSFTIDDSDDLEYEIPATGTLTVSIPGSTVTGATAGCALEFSVEILDYPSNTWTTVSEANATSKYTFIVADAALDARASNAFDVQTTDHAAWANTSF